MRSTSWGRKRRTGAGPLCTYQAELLMGLSGIALALAEIAAARAGKPVEDFLEETALGLAEEFS
jgi:L-alanine-DL-glutamate epimerase-like enolase superfamily enzyme